MTTQSSLTPLYHFKQPGLVSSSATPVFFHIQMLAFSVSPTVTAITCLFVIRGSRTVTPSEALSSAETDLYSSAMEAPVSLVPLN